MDFAAELAHKFGHSPTVSAAELRSLPPDQATHTLLERILPPGLDANRVADQLHLYRAHMRATKNYDPPPGAQRLLLVQAAGAEPGIRNEAKSAWQSRVAAPLDHHLIDGNHFTLLCDPNVQALAQALTAVTNG